MNSFSSFTSTIASCVTAALVVSPVFFKPAERFQSVAAAQNDAAAQGVNQPTATTIPYIVLVVRDIERLANRFANAMGIPAPEARSSSRDGSAVKTARLELGNVTIELIEPASGEAGRYSEFLKTHGGGVYQFGLDRGPGRDAVVVGLSKPELTVEPMGPELRREYPNRPHPPFTGGLPLTRTGCVTHLGVGVLDIDDAYRRFIDLLGVTGTPPQQFKTGVGAAKYSIFNVQNVSVELLSNLPDGTYAESLHGRKQSGHHIGFHLRGTDVGFEMGDQITWFERHGGKTAIKSTGYSYVDFGLGVFMEAQGESTSNRVYPHPHRD